MNDPVQQVFERHFGPEFGHGKPFDSGKLRAALGALGDPHTKLPPVIHVAGTNGKGSTIAFMRAIAEAAGLRVHAFTKPHLHLLSERFVVAGAPAQPEALIAAAGRVATADANLTQFDAQTAAAFLLFSETPADLALIETGMGGREDSTNVIARPALCVLTPIGLDHQDVLGETLQEIAAHKAGILKAGVPAITAPQFPEALEVIEAAARRLRAPLWRRGVEWDAYASHGKLVAQTENRALDLPLPALVGGHQIDNAGLAVAALLRWRELDESAIAAGLLWARWPGRLQPIIRGALTAPIRAAGGEVWADVGHNGDAAEALARALEAMQRRRRMANVVILGVRARKDAPAIIAKFAPITRQIIGVPLSEDHALAERIALFATGHGIDGRAAKSLGDAIDMAALTSNARVLICGSFLVAAEALRSEGG